MNRIDWQRWAMAVWYDLVGKEDKQQLTRVEKIYYNVYAAVVFFGVGGLMFLVVPSPALASLLSIICFVVGIRKMFIFWNKKRQWKEENKDYKAADTEA